VDRGAQSRQVAISKKMLVVGMRSAMPAFVGQGSPLVGTNELGLGEDMALHGFEK